MSKIIQMNFVKGPKGKYSYHNVILKVSLLMISLFVAYPVKCLGIISHLCSSWEKSFSSFSWGAWWEHDVHQWTMSQFFPLLSLLSKLFGKFVFLRFCRKFVLLPVQQVLNQTFHSWKSYVFVCLSITHPVCIGHISHASLQRPL